MQYNGQNIEPVFDMETAFSLAMLYFEFIENKDGGRPVVERGPLMQMVNYIHINGAYYITEYMEDILTSPKKLAKAKNRYLMLCTYRQFMDIYEAENKAHEYITQWDIFQNIEDIERFEYFIGLRERPAEPDAEVVAELKDFDEDFELDLS